MEESPYAVRMSGERKIQVWILGCGLLALLAPAGLRGEHQLERGMTRAEVVKELGQPTGDVQGQERTVLSYPTGQVILENGNVVEWRLRTAQQQSRLEADRRERLALRAEAADQEEARRAAAREAKLEILTRPGYAQLDPEERIAVWRAFKEQFPEADVASHLQAARRVSPEGVPSGNRGSRVVPYSRSYPVWPYRGKARAEEARPGIREFPGATLFTPDMGGLPGGAIRSSIEARQAANGQSD